MAISVYCNCARRYVSVSGVVHLKLQNVVDRIRTAQVFELTGEFA